jgi:hypothetical protein
MKPIKGYEHRYRITRNGLVWSKKIEMPVTTQNFITTRRFGGFYLKSFKDRHGYSLVNLWVNGKSKLCKIHRLVAETFIPNPDKKPCVNHKNGIKSDNRVENLEWVTPKENNAHAIKIGLKEKLKRNKLGRFLPLKQ